MFWFQCKMVKSAKAKFTTRSLKMLFVLVIGCGPIACFAQFMRTLPGFCYFGNYLFLLSIYFQTIFMGFYQLSRIHYCFSKKSKGFAKNGYSIWVFIVMYTIGTILIIYASVYPLIQGITTSCGINVNYQYYQLQIRFVSVENISVYFQIYAIIYYSWDLGTIFLYLLKIRSFRKKFDGNNAEIWGRILLILQRVLINTFFYEIIVAIISIIFVIAGYIVYNPSLYPSYIVTISTIVWYSSGMVSSIIYCLAMIFMVNHNDAKYIKFLQFVRCLKLDYICCCCCSSMVLNQLNAMNGDESKLENVVNEKKDKSSIWETNISRSVDDPKIKESGNELSMATITVQCK